MKTTIKNENSKNLMAHTTANVIGGADGEIWLGGPVVSGYGEKEWCVNEGRNECAYCVAKFYTRKEAEAKVRELRAARNAMSAPRYTVSSVYDISGGSTHRTPEAACREATKMGHGWIVKDQDGKRWTMNGPDAVCID